MGRIFYDVESYSTALDIEIAESMRDPEGTVQRGARKAIKESADENVYYAYTPKFLSRRGESFSSAYGGGGGIIADNNIISISTEKGFTVTLIDAAPWQHLYGGSYPTSDLTDVIEKNGMYGAPPRPFMQEAEDKYGDQFGDDLVSELELKGF